MKGFTKVIGLFVFALLLGTQAVFAQASATAELRGFVTDPNGAVIAGAKITATDAGKGTTRTVTSDSDGGFVILSLLPSTYNVKVEATGFSTKTYNNVVLEVGQQFELKAELVLGNVGAVVDVLQSDEALVQTEKTQQSDVIGTRQIQNLPINRRNFLDFALLTPGVSDSDNINDSTDARVAQTPGSGLSFGGSNGRGNSITVDGASADTASGSSREVLSQEGVQEFQVNRNSYGAEFGGSYGGSVNIVSKTGSNSYRGSAFAYFRDKKFDAKNVFDGNPSGKSPFNRQQFGGSLGGPIVENKTFFFVSAEGLREKRTAFVNLNNNIAAGLQINTATASGGLQNNFLNYLASKPAFAPLSAGVRSALTVANTRTTNLYNSTSGQFPFKTTNGIISGRIDHTFSESDSAFIRLNYGDSYLENQATGALNAISRGRLLEARNSGILFSETHSFNPTTINEFKAQFSYFDFFVTPNDTVGPEVSIDGFGNFARDIFLPSRNIDRRFEVADNISMVRGTHTAKFGFVFQQGRVATNSDTYTGGRFFFGALPFGILFTAQQAAIVSQINADVAAGTLTVPQAQSLSAALSTTTINSLQAYQTNLPQVFQVAFGDTFFANSSRRFAAFAQDTWKVRPNVTLNYGLRYFLTREADPLPLDKNNFQPRVGISWDVFSNGKTVLRAGGGIFTGTIDSQIVNVVNTLASGTQPFSLNIITSSIQSPGLQSSAAIYQTLLAQGVIGTRSLRASDITQFGLSTAPGRPLEARIRLGENFENGESYQASAAIQQELPYGFNVELSYLFTRGIHLIRPVDVRNYRLNPTNVTCANGIVQQASCYSSQPRLLNTTPFALDAVYQSSANSFYNAGTIVLTKRFANNFSINTNYTFAKTIDDSTDFNTDFLAQNPLNRRDDRGLSSFDQRHKFVMTGVFVSSSKNAVLKDFVFSPIFNYGSARPFNLVLGSDAIGNGDSRTLSDRPAGAGRNTGKGDSFTSVDFRLARRFLAKESRFLELTFEGFNIFNTKNFNSVNNTVGTACVGGLVTNPSCTPSATVIPVNARGGRDVPYTNASAARQLQFGVRYNF